MERGRVMGIPTPAIDAAARTVALLYLVFHVTVLTAYPMDPLLFRAWHVGGMAIFAYLGWLSAARGGVAPLVVLGGLAASVAGTLYLTIHIDDIEMRAGVLPEALDTVFAALMLIAILDVTRRATGNALVILAAGFIVYGLAGPYLPGALSHQGYGPERLLTFLYTTNGVYGIPVGSSATFIYFFVVFGALLAISGGADYMMKLALACTGRSVGGTAKVSVVASGLFGMINGTSAGNVVATGSMTIPMMVRSGFKPHFAGATEAVASSGGQILPPVMGAAAFLMVEMTGIPYADIVVGATLPALLYFFAVYMMVHYEAVKTGVTGAEAVAIPDAAALLRKSYYLIPLIVLIVALMVLNVSIIRAALYSLLSAFVISYFDRRTAIGPRRLMDAAMEGAQGIVAIAATCATAGIVIGVLNLTGLGIKVASLIVGLTGGVLWLTLVVTMIVTIILGMGMPTVAAYAITGAVVAPALVRLGVEPMGAHLFILFFASMSAITPPVALASYAAAAVARADLNALSMTALKLGLAGFIIPFMLVYRPGMMFIGPLPDALFSAGVAIVSIWAIAAALQYPYRHALMRVLMLAGAVAMIWPGLESTVGGFAVIVAVTLWQRRVAAA
ncbi:hypothetical protein VY88_20225 [Azospirillum thiophilum]|uniref:TRAP C4-dicarboxylate transport system permease DctM subunit domain-containing protein n=2 Tax=Azospirillum thiophilum TaxID=528244 RepID=A0AAC8W3Q3_9PROT|nr:hypothetical protein AL072_25745 [Azospirillum thiophilum]KJR63985.1 hypothetical protein VY88_20225 [Azospirillum thiophilum]